MDKKLYITPETEITDIAALSVIAASSAGSGDLNGDPISTGGAAKDLDVDLMDFDF